jgi:hypothetical protein
MNQTDEKIPDVLSMDNTAPNQQAETAHVEDAAQSSLQKGVEEIDSTSPAGKPGKPASKTTVTKEEQPPNPLLSDPYEWDQCTITLVYALLPDQTVSVSIHNHKDEPIVKSFKAAEVHLPGKISGVMATLQTIWPDSTVSATVVFLPKPVEVVERTIVVSVRAGSDTPIVQTGLESDLPLPLQISTMLDELKVLLPTRALKRIEKDAKAKVSPTIKPVAKAAAKSPAKPTSVAPAAANKTQMTLF